MKTYEGHTGNGAGKERHDEDVHIYIPPIPQDPFDESVYDLIPIAVTPPAKHARHVSKFAPLARQEYWSGTKPMASMGPLRVVSHGPERYLKRGDGDKLKPEVPKHHPNRSVRKAPLPEEPGVIPGPSGTDFIKSNRATMVHSEPPAPAPAPRSFRRKANYGRAPTYLEQRKIELEQMQEAAYLESGAAELAAEGAGAGAGGDMVLLPESERRAILEGLRANWEKLNSEYQKLSLTVDTVPKIARKVNMEQHLKRIEEDILRFSHENIYVKFEP
ncbi:calmodulin-binding-domain-containing protein [Catenaria anguillulae PL171]|uniref:Calmodulin-binding-domain-containing protein n=1 Tax=Catenaria anguillulae PL171 TaxID=765915 RepID=A0A1Y2HIP8_9FUNG|nr:calmodulin-binding-domain-containing protein [Catenaria anguillulae PL171]